MAEKHNGKRNPARELAELIEQLETSPSSPTFRPIPLTAMAQRSICALVDAGFDALRSQWRPLVKPDSILVDAINLLAPQQD